MIEATAPRAARTVVAALAGAVALATTGAPQSLEYVLRVGLDSPGPTGAQLAVGASGAVATAIAVLLSRHWRALLAVGAAGLFVASLIHLPNAGELTARILGPAAQAPAADVTVHPVAAALLAAASGILLIGLLGAAGHLFTGARAAVAGITAAAAYYGVAILGPLSQSGSVVRLTLLAVAALLAAGALSDRSPATRPGRVGTAAAVVVLLPVVPTALVAVTGQPVLGTSTGWFVGILLVALAFMASGGLRTLLAVAACGLVLAAPVTLLLYLHSAPASGQPWYAWPLALLGVLGGVAAAMHRRRLPVAAALTALGAVPMITLGLQVANENRGLAQVLAWTFLVLAMTAVTASVGAAASTGRPEQLPAFGALVIAAAVGFTAAAGLFAGRKDGEAGLNSLLGPNGMFVSAGYVLVAAVLLIVLTRLQDKGAQDVSVPPATQVSDAEAEPAQQ